MIAPTHLIRDGMVPGHEHEPGRDEAPRTVQRYGLLGSWKSRFPVRDLTYSSLDTVVWKTAGALRRLGKHVIVGGAEVLPESDDGIGLVAIDGRPDGALREALKRLPIGGASDLLRWTSRLSHPFHLLQGVAALRGRGAEIIQVTHEFANLRTARLLAGRAPLVTHVHAVWIDDYPRLARRLLEADAVATVSDFVGRALVEVEPKLEGRTATVRNGVDLEVFPGKAVVEAEEGDGVRAWRRRLDALDRPLIVAVGRVAAEKGHHVLAAASRILAERGHDVVVAVAGDMGGPYARPGPGRSPLWQEIERLSSGYVENLRATVAGLPFHLLGKVPLSGVRCLMAAADVFVGPSAAPEPFGLPVLEAMAMNLPVVASDSGGYPELVGTAGILVPPGDAGALADSIETLLASPFERSRLALAARTQASRYTWDATAAQLVSLAERLS
jgi:glycosyltransferase involved in cell wall biosynthesis